MAVGGLPEPNHTHPFDVALAALAMRELVRTMNREREMLHLTPWHLRIGLHTGPVIAGVVGSRKFAYDIWGDTVNIAARLQAYILERIKPGLSSDAEGVKPNPEFVRAVT